MCSGTQCCAVVWGGRECGGQTDAPEPSDAGAPISCPAVRGCPVMTCSTAACPALPRRCGSGCSTRQPWTAAQCAPQVSNLRQRCQRRQLLRCLRHWHTIGIHGGCTGGTAPITISSAAGNLHTFDPPSPLPAAELVRLVIEEELEAVRKELGSTEK